MRINHNIAALNTYRQLENNTSATSKSLEKLSSGLRINSAADDAAGLAISEKMRAQIRGLDMASRNAQDGISLVQTAEGALNETQSILQRMRELAVQSANDTNTSSDRTKLQSETDQLAKEITRISNTTEFNTRNLLNGGIDSAKAGEVTFQIGANADQNLSLAIGAMDAASLGVARDGVTSKVSGGNVSGVTISTSSTASGNYTISSTTVAATVATTANTGTATATGLASGGTGAVTVSVDGTTRRIAISGTNTFSDLATALDAVTGLDARVSGSVLVLSASTSGAHSVGITNVSGSVSTNFGIATGTIASGKNASLTVTLTPTTGTAITKTGVATNATSIAFSGGITITKSASTTSGLSGTVEITRTASSAAKFSGADKTADAVTFGGIDISTQSGANAAITTINNAIEKVSEERSKLGAYQNRLEHTINNLGTTSQNLTSSESRIRDVDMAKEMSEFTKNNILSQAAQAMLAQANQLPQGVLQLLR